MGHVDGAGVSVCDLCPSCLQTSHSPKSHQADPSHSAEDWKGDRGKADDHGYMHRPGKSRPPPPFTFCELVSNKSCEILSTSQMS